MHKTIILTARVCNFRNLPGWRQSRYNLRQIKKLYRIVQKIKRSPAKNATKHAKQERKLKEAYEIYLEVAASFLDKAEAVVAPIASDADERIDQQRLEIKKYIGDGRRQIDQIQRRIFKGEAIPHDEKIFSLFERHTEWISKGKAGVPQELGQRVCLLTDQYGFILYHQVLKKQTDDKVAVDMVEQTQLLFPTFEGCSFDKGFYTPENRETLLTRLKHLVLPKKGALSPADQALENDPEFIARRRQHSAIESAINALENHGLDRCLDHGEDGFERYVALAKVARNLQIVGHFLLEKDRKAQTRRARYHATWQRNRAICQLA
jgi:vacuolar-type H+-ATPase subunit H